MVVINIHGSAYKIDFYCNPYPSITTPHSNVRKNEEPKLLSNQKCTPT